MSDLLKTAAIILAAGQSRRMGSENKLLKTWGGKLLVEHVCYQVLHSNCSSVTVVVGHQEQRVRNALKHLNLNFVLNPDFANGIASSIEAGVRSAANSNADSVVILLGDMPQVGSQMINKLIATANTAPGEAIVIAACEGKKGNPVLWPSNCFDQLMALKGDQGARQIMEQYEDRIVTVELGAAARFDLDTPDAFKSIATP